MTVTGPGNEERYPLLLLYVEENGKKSEFPQRVVFADKGRGKEVIRGAAAIITQWPAQISSCWLTSVALGTAFIFLSLILLMSSINPLLYPVHPRCSRDILDHTGNGNNTIHLVKHGNVWSHRQLDILRLIAENYPDFEIRNIMLDMTLKNFKKRERKKEITTSTERRERKKEITSTERTHFHFMHIPDLSTIFSKKLSDILKNDQIVSDETPKEETKITKNTTLVSKNNNTTSKRIKRSVRFFNLPSSYEDILSTYPNIKEIKTTYKNYFTNTPLHYFWIDFTPEMILFSVRVLELWQNGGISFYIPNHIHNHEPQIINITHEINKPNILPRNLNEEINVTRLKMLISSTKLQYEKLTDDLISIDEQGLHMATKIPCHSFFGEMIIKLQRNMEKITITEFIQQILNTFCSRGAVDSEYCKKT